MTSTGFHLHNSTRVPQIPWMVEDPQNPRADKQNR